MHRPQVAWVDLVAHWKYQYRPVRKVSFQNISFRGTLTRTQLVFMLVELVIGIAIGYIPCTSTRSDRYSQCTDNTVHRRGQFRYGILRDACLVPC